MKLEEIGFYTLEDERAKRTSLFSPYWRCELVLTDVCNFRCPYCRGVKKELQGSMSFGDALKTVDFWCESNLKNIRFSGGEPTLWPGILDLVSFSRNKGVQRIAISTNGSAEFSLYKKLFEKGVNDFSISLDACCASTGEIMSGTDAWNHVTDNIRQLSKLTYVTIGVVLTRENVGELDRIINFASDDLGVSDIRIIPAAQWNEPLKIDIHPEILQRHPILRYRIRNFQSGRHVRGIKETDSHQCPLVMDDMAVMAGYHFPCIIYLREHGDPIGRIDDRWPRLDRFSWFQKYDTFEDPICRKNCLDVCIDYNNKVRDLRKL